jgi:hypothetical protein
MQNQPLTSTGAKLAEGGESLKLLSALVSNSNLALENPNASMSGQRMNFAADQMILAGNELCGVKPEPPKGKSWLKG